MDPDDAWMESQDQRDEMVQECEFCGTKARLYRVTDDLGSVLICRECRGDMEYSQQGGKELLRP